MDILIKGMEMPKSCFLCFKIRGIRLKNCPIRSLFDTKRYDEVDAILETDERHKDCPLIEFPEHGEKYCDNCKWCHEGHYEEEGEQPYIKRKCTNKYGMTPNYSVYEHDYCSRWEANYGTDN